MAAFQETSGMSLACRRDRNDTRFIGSMLFTVDLMKILRSYTYTLVRSNEDGDSRLS